MARFYGVVGYGEAVETSPGVWVDQIVERLDAAFQGANKLN